MQKDSHANMGIINFNNYINSDTEVKMPLKTEGNKLDTDRVNKTTILHEQRNHKVKSAMIVLSSQKTQNTHPQ